MHHSSDTYILPSPQFPPQPFLATGTGAAASLGHQKTEPPAWWRAPPPVASEGRATTPVRLHRQRHGDGAGAGGRVQRNPHTMMKQQQAQQNRHCDEFAAAEYLGLKVTTLRDWRIRKRGPVYAKFGKAVRYPISELEKYAEAARFRMAA